MVQGRRQNGARKGRARHRAHVGADTDSHEHPARAKAWCGVLSVYGDSNVRDAAPRHVAMRAARGQGVSNRGREFFKGKAKRAIKRATMNRCGQRCVYCAVPLELDTATLDHVFPVAHGGRHDPPNLVVACRACNQLKGDMLPLDFFYQFPWAGQNFCRYARAANRALKRGAKRAVSLAYAA